MVRRMSIERVLYGLFLLLIMGTLVFAREFSYIHVDIGGGTLYVTEAFLLGWLSLRGMRIPEIAKGMPNSVVIGLASYLAVGAFAILRGMAEGREALLILRDSALFYYALFIFVAADLLRTSRKREQVVTIFAISAFPLVVLGSLRLATGDSVSLSTSLTVRSLSIAQALYLVLAVVAAAAALSLRWRPRALYLAAVPIAFVAMFLAQSRSIVVVLPVVILVFLGSRWPAHARFSVPAAVASLAFALAAVWLFESADLLPEYAAGQLQTLVSYGTDPNAVWRMDSWKAALDLAGQDPLLGRGLAMLSLLPDEVAPHNSVVTILFESGLVGVMAFAILIGAYYWNSLRSLTEPLRKDDRAINAFGLASQVAMLGVAIFNVALEGPFIAVLFWTVMGMTLRLGSPQAQGEQRTA